MSNTSKNVNRRFYIGTISGGKTYIFALGEYRTEAAAIAKARSSERNSAVYIFECYDVKHIASGIIWGRTGYRYVSTVQPGGPLDEAR